MGLDLLVLVPFFSLIKASSYIKPYKNPRYVDPAKILARFNSGVYAPYHHFLDPPPLGRTIHALFTLCLYWLVMLGILGLNLVSQVTVEVINTRLIGI